MPVAHVNRLLALVALGVAAYANSFEGEFVFDDTSNIMFSPEARELWPRALTSRTVWRLSLAVNYAAGGLDPWGYHAFNLAIHLGASLALFGLTRRTLLLPRFGKRFVRSADWLAFAIAAVWLVHPLCTQGVTYIVQRGESMMGLAFLFSMYAFVRGATSTRRWCWYSIALLTFLIGMGCKETMAMVPLVILLYDRTLISESWNSIVKRRWWLYAAMVPPLIWLGLRIARPLFVETANSTAKVGFAYKGVSPLEYAATQPQVILHYLRLAFWPHPLVLDYGWPVETSGVRILWTSLLIAILVGLTSWGLIRRSPFGFLGAAFFLTLAPTSSFVPIKDLAFEHRVYLPLAAVVACCVMAVHSLGKRLTGDGKQWWPVSLQFTLLFITLGLFSWRTILRNSDYSSPVRLWTTVVEARPDNATGWQNLGVAHANSNDLDSARTCFEHAISLQPNSQSALHSLAKCAWAEGELDEARTLFERLLQEWPKDGPILGAYGGLLLQRGEYDRAEQVLVSAIAHHSVPYHAHHDFALLCTTTSIDRDAEAVAHLRKAIDLHPQFASARWQLAWILATSHDDQFRDGGCGTRTNQTVHEP